MRKCCSKSSMQPHMKGGSREDNEDVYSPYRQSGWTEEERKGEVLPRG